MEVINTTIGKAIKWWMKEQSEKCGYKILPYEVNSGMCDQLAEFIEDTIEDTKIIVIEDEFPDLSHISHYVIFHKDKYYDAEAPYGVDDIHDLPIVRHDGDVQYHRKMEAKIWKK